MSLVCICNYFGSVYKEIQFTCSHLNFSQKISLLMCLFPPQTTWRTTVVHSSRSRRYGSLLTWPVYCWRAVRSSSRSTWHRGTAASWVRSYMGSSLVSRCGLIGWPAITICGTLPHCRETQPWGEYWSAWRSIKCLTHYPLDMVVKICRHVQIHFLEWKFAELWMELYLHGFISV